MKRKLLPFGWFGGKFRLLDWLLPLLPDADTFVDVFGGSGCVLLNRKPATVEVFNDIDGELVNFFRVLRADPDALVKQATLTPYSREEHRIACQHDATVSDLERARRFYVRAKQSLYGKPQWATAPRPAAGTEPPEVWAGYPARLPPIAHRLRNAYIENKPALDLIPRWDRDCTLFYCDPPYVHSTRHSTGNYAFEMSADDDHAALADVLQAIKGKAAVSGYPSPLYDRLYDGWHRTDAPPLSAASARNGPNSPIRQECLWTNYDPAEATGQPSLF